MYTFLDTFWGQDEKFTIMQQKRNVFFLSLYCLSMLIFSDLIQFQFSA